MKLVKKTDEYSIYQRGDNRYAVKDAHRKPVNGDEKAKILVAEDLIKATLSSKPAVEEAPVEEASPEAAEEGAAVEASAEESPAEEVPAEEETAEASEPAEEPAEESDK